MKMKAIIEYYTKLHEITGEKFEYIKIVPYS